ncbi:MAG: chlorite dismutase family protein, partial [Gemmatimonadota bacterium]|nr:chlorite dismutase family protein [Gemmatimonadota bacterium]
MPNATKPARPAQSIASRAAHPPETLEGWYALHQIFSIDRGAMRALDKRSRDEQRAGMAAALRELATPVDGGWSAAATLIGSSADVMLIHFRPTLDAIGEAQRRVRREPLLDALRPAYAFLSITEAGLYHITAELCAAAEARGGEVGDEEYAAAVAGRAQAERESPHLRRRLYPPLPADMPYVCFYPMSKRRDAGQNWYSLSLADRSRLMHTHGATGRRYAGKVVQVITGAIGFDAWEWGVTLFARDPLDLKKLVTDMRFDEVSAKYA